LTEEERPDTYLGGREDNDRHRPMREENERGKKKIRSEERQKTRDEEEREEERENTHTHTFPRRIHDWMRKTEETRTTKQMKTYKTTMR